MNVDWQRDKEGLITGATTNVTLKNKCEAGSGKIKLDGGNVTYEKEVNPSCWKEDNWHFGLKFVGKSVPKDTLFKWTSEARFGFPKITSDLGLGGSLAVTCGSDKKLIGLGTFVARVFNDFHGGLVYERDLKDNKNLALEFLTTAKLNNDLFTFGAWNHFTRNLAFGGTYNVNRFIDKTAMLVTFNLNRDKDGNLGPKTFSFISQKKLDDNSSVRIRADVENSLVVTGVLTTKITDNLKLRVADTIDPIAAYTNRNLKTYQYGMSLDFEY